MRLTMSHGLAPRLRGDHDGAVARERHACRAGARQLRGDGALRRPSASRALGRDEDRARGRIVLGLRDEIRGDPVRAAAIRADDDLARAGVQVDGAVARDERLGRRDPRVARPDDLVHAWRSTRVPYASAAIACAPPMRSTRVAPASTRGAQHRRRRVSGSTRRSRATPATRAGIDRHEQRRRQRISAAGHVTADARERLHALFDPDAGPDRDRERSRQLARSHARDVPRRQLQRDEGSDRVSTDPAVSCQRSGFSSVGPLAHIRRICGNGVRPRRQRLPVRHSRQRAHRLARGRRATMRATPRSTRGSRAASRASRRSSAR